MCNDNKIIFDNRLKCDDCLNISVELYNPKNDN